MMYLRTLAAHATFLTMTGMSAAALAAPGGSQAEEQRVNNLLETMIKGDYVRFASYGTPAFAELTEQQFSAVAAQMGPRLKQGYDLEYFGMLRQQDLDISVWKISFRDDSDDLLATLNVQDGKVGGFFLR